MKTNSGINCSVTACKYNVEDCKCNLDEVKISCACGDTCTCCASFTEEK